MVTRLLLIAFVGLMSVGAGTIVHNIIRYEMALRKIRRDVRDAAEKR